MRSLLFLAMLGSFGMLRATSAEKPAAKFQLHLPTANQTLLAGQESAFYQFVDRTTNGVTTQVWEGGKYGFVRNPRMGTDGKSVYTRFHEGIDIAPAQRDAKGEPLDDVRAMAEGIVVHVNAKAALSNYGNFIVVRHDTQEGPFFSLYAHLKQTSVNPGQRVKQDQPLGLLGYTGSGLDRRRAHLHAEINLLLSEKFNAWHSAGSAAPNHHGIFNGMNLAGIDLAGFIKAQKADPSLTLGTYVRRTPAYFVVRVPSGGRELEIVTRYPWLRRPGAMGASWNITFSASGLPLGVSPTTAKCGFPAVTSAEYFSGPYAWNTRSLLAGSGKAPMLSKEGLRYVNLVTGDFPLEPIKPAVPVPPASPPPAGKEKKPG